MVRRHLSKELKKEWLAKWVVRSARRNREGKSVLLDKLCEDFKYERKYTIICLTQMVARNGPRVLDRKSISRPDFSVEQDEKQIAKKTGGP
jgi:hypothetical protein